MNLTSFFLFSLVDLVVLFLAARLWFKKTLNYKKLVSC